MERVLPAWQLRHLSDGVLLVPPQGRHLGALRLREHQRPLRSAREIFARAWPGRAPIERLCTSEGEYAALQIERGPHEGKPLLRCLGAVFGDDSYTLVEASTGVVERFDFFEQAARTFTRHCSLGLGSLRRRQYLYAPPPAWEGVARGLDADWRAPGYPATDARITVHAAQPGTGGAEELRDALLLRSGLEGWTGLDACELPVTARLRARAWQGSGRQDDRARTWALVVLDDGRFRYPIELACTPGDLVPARTALLGLAASVESIPPPAPRTERAGLHWIA